MDSIGNLVTIGIIIYVIYSIKKFFSGSQKDGTAPQRGGWADKLGNFINEIKEEIEKAGQGASQPPPHSNSNDDFSWDDLMTSTNVEEETSSSKTISQTVFYEPEKRVQHTPPPVELPPVPEESHRNYHGMHDAPEPVYDHFKKNTFITKKDLKKAIVWSEILSKPIGLRDS